MTLTVLVLGCVACFVYMIHDLQTQPRQTDLGNGDLHFDERQTIEAYQREIAPIAEQALAVLEGTGFGEVERLDESSMSCCGGLDRDGLSLNAGAGHGGMAGDSSSRKTQPDTPFSVHVWSQGDRPGSRAP